MPNNETAKTKWARKPVFWWATSIIALFGASSLILLPMILRETPKDYVLKVYHNPDVPSHHWGPLKSSPWAYYLKAARTADEQTKGLSGTKELASNRGMIFLYEDTAERCFWMKDMNYAIDMIWVDESYKVTAIEHGVRPDSYPKTFCHDAHYVIELNAGEASKAGLKQGQRLNF